jgi:zinc transporter ZupT
MPFLAFLTALGCGLLGLWLTDARRHARVAVTFSAGVLLGVSAFGLVPDLMAEMGWAGSLSLFAAGYLSLLLVDRFVYPVCPSCSHSHDHGECATLLHGFAAPLVSAAALHSFLDGWSIATAQAATPAEIRLALPIAVVLHKIPEGIALGAILRASVRLRLAAFGWCVVAEAPTLLGALLAMMLAPRLGATWTNYPLAVAAGWFFYLGFHAIHGEWRRRGPVPVFVPALTGIAGAAVLQQSVRAIFR